MKKIILKFLVSLFSIFLFVLSIIDIIDYIQQIIQMTASYELTIRDFLPYLIRQILYLITSILLFLIVNIKGLNFLTQSLTDITKKRYLNNKEKRLAKKQADLEREIAEKQAALDEMKKG